MKFNKDKIQKYSVNGLALIGVVGTIAYGVKVGTECLEKNRDVKRNHILEGEKILKALKDEEC